MVIPTLRLQAPLPLHKGFNLCHYRALCSCDFKNPGETHGLNEIFLLVAICFDVFLFLVPICNFIMDPPPKKWCLTHQFLMEVTRREGLTWEANLAAHVNTILFLVFISFCIMCKANKASLQNRSETFHYGTISKQAIFMAPTESSFLDHMP